MALGALPGFVVRTALVQAAADNGYRLERPSSGGWLAFDSTSAHGRLWLAGEGDHGPWWLASDHPGVAEALGSGAAASGPGLRRWVCSTKRELYAILGRAYQLGASLPDAPLIRFVKETALLPRETEVERLTIQRVGQALFRQALIDYWGGRCAVTGIDDARLLRASHILPWAACGTDAERLDCYNGLLLSALWDAAFDAGLVSFDREGQALLHVSLSLQARHALGESRHLSMGLPDQTWDYMLARKELINSSKFQPGCQVT